MSTILLADDEDSLRALVRATLGDDHRLIEARDGRAAPPPGAAAGLGPAEVSSRGASPRDRDQALAYAQDLKTLYEAARTRAARFRLLVEMGRDLVGVRGLDALLTLALERALT